MSVVRKSFLSSLVEAHLGMVIQIASVVILARILTPEEVGIYSVAASVVILSAIVRDFGVAEYLIQERELNRDTLRAALSVQMIVSWTLAGVLFLGCAAFADIYREPGIAQVINVQCFNLLLIPFGAVTMAYFRREMHYRPVFVVGIASSFVSATTAIAMALMDQGYMSLAWASLAGVLTTVVLANVLRPAAVPLLPGLRGIRPAFSFGSYASLIYIVEEGVKHAPALAIGRSLSMESVGMFSRAAGSIDLFNRSIGGAANRVLLPFFAAQMRSGLSVKEGYVRQIAYMTGVGWPFCCVLGLLAFPIVRMLYGDQWDLAVPLVQFLCVGFAVELALANAPEALVALGRIRKGTQLALTTGAVRVGCVLLSVPFGLRAVCFGLIAAALINLVVIFRTMRQVLELQAFELVRAIARSAGAAMLTALAVACVFLLREEPEGYVLEFFLGGLLGVSAWVVGLVACKHPLGNEVLSAAQAIGHVVAKRRV